mgnify:CR=1 FL=1
MSKKLELKEHLQQLQSISDILGAMKNLAVLESQKVSRRLENLGQFARELDQYLGELTDFQGDIIHGQQDDEIFVLIGSERGFCAEFNERLAAEVNTADFKSQHPLARIVVVGEKLQSKMGEDDRVIEVLEGANVIDDIQVVLTTLVDCLADLTAEHSGTTVTAIFHENNRRLIKAKSVMPPDLSEAPGKKHRISPILYLPPEKLLREILDQYVFVLLSDIAHRSLSAENQYRAQHLTGAIRKLDDATADLNRKYHMQRQEEIIEEIEVILLSAIDQ